MCLLGACSSTRHSALPPATTTSAPPPATTTTTTLDLIPQESPDIAANALFSAWQHGDRATASHLAIPAVVAALFGRPPESVSDRGCQDPIAGQSSCAFGAGAGLVTVHTVSLAGGWVIDSIVFE